MANGAGSNCNNAICAGVRTCPATTGTPDNNKTPFDGSGKVVIVYVAIEPSASIAANGLIFVAPAVLLIPALVTLVATGGWLVTGIVNVAGD